MRVVAQGDNFTVARTSGGVAHLKVVRRPDLSLEQGAENARQMLAALATLLRDRGKPATALLMDMSEAPLAGPKTRETLGELITGWAEAGCRVAVVTTHPTMRMMFRRLLGECAAEAGQCFDDLRSAELWAAGVPLEAVSTSGAFTRIGRSSDDESA